MRSRRPTRRIPLLAVATTSLALAAAGCGGGEQTATGATPAPPPSTTVALGTTSTIVADPTSALPATSEAPGTTEPPGTTTTTALPLPAASPQIGPGDNRVFVLGDSVLAGAKAELPAALKGWKVTVDAQESRFVTNGVAVLDSKRTALDKERATTYDDEKAAAEASGAPLPAEPVKATLVDAVGRVVVVNLCTNYEATGAFATLIPRYMEALKTMDRVVWMTCSEWSAGQVEANEAIRAAAPKYKNSVVADWARYSDTPGYTYQDGIHLDTPGRKAAAELVALAVGPAPKAK